MLNLVVLKVTTRSQGTENENMQIYHDPGTVHVHPLVFMTILKGIQFNLFHFP